MMQIGKKNETEHTAGPRDLKDIGIPYFSVRIDLKNAELPLLTHIYTPNIDEECDNLYTYYNE